MSEHDLVLAGKSVELVGSSPEILACKLGNSLCYLNIKALGSVKTCSNGSTAESKLFKLGKSNLKELLVLFERRTPAADLLRECDRCSVLKMSSSALYDALMLFFEALECSDKLVNSGNYLVLNGNNSGNVHCCGEGIV